MMEEEIIAYLGKTSLPTLLVEGEGDAAIYRWLEDRLGSFSGSVLFCSGRNSLISIYRKRATFPHGKLVWLADLDMWRFSAPPPDLGGIVFTAGYSIENDLYAGSRIEDLLGADERVRHQQLLTIVCRWFSFEVQEFLAGREAQVAHHIGKVVDLTNMEIRPLFARERGYSEPDSSFVQSILDEYALSLRGKTLVQALVALLSDKQRASKFSHANIIEMCLKLHPDNRYMERILSEARQRLL